VTSPRSLASVAALLALVAACSADREVVGLPLGSMCGPATVACADGLLCVDALCVVRPWPPDAVSLDDTVTPIDLGVPAPDTSTDDTVEQDVMDDAGPSDVAPDGQEDGDDTDVGAFNRLVIGDHTGAEAPSDDAVTLQVDQAAVTELVSPAAGRLVTLEVIAVEPPGGVSCGVFHVVFWLPDDSGGWPVAPDWYGPVLALVGSDVPQELVVDDGPEVPVGPFRVGLVYTGACSATPHQPRVVVDDSGDIDGTWLWARVGTTATFISGETLDLSGRWAIRAGLDVPVE